MSKKTISKDMVPEGITVQMSIVDMIPVLFFGAIGILLGIILGNPFVGVCAFLCFISGFLKVLWKFIVAMKHKNVWGLFMQMRICMPIGFIGLIIGLIYSFSKIPWEQVSASLFGLPQLVFFILGVVGMIAMIVFSVRLDSADPKANWIEQSVNSLAQAFFFIGVLMIYLH